MKYNHKEEWEANEFACELLMPRKEFIDFCKNEAKKSDTNTIDVNKVAEHFRVSTQAAIIRGQIFGLWR